MSASLQARSRRVAPLLRRMAGMTLLWVVLVGGELRSLGLAALAVMAAAALATALQSQAPWHLRPMGVLRFVPLFLWSSVLGGFDVAVRAFRRRPGLAPTMMHMRLHLDSNTAAATFFISLISVLPGSLCATEDDGHLQIHVLDRHQANEARLRKLERAVGAMFGVPVAEATP